MNSFRGVAFVLGIIALQAGCSKTNSPSTPPATLPVPGPMAGADFDAESGPHAAGKKVVVANGCFRCHMIDGKRGSMGSGPPMGGFGGPGGGSGSGPGGGPGRPGGGPGQAPDLGKVGKDPAHTVEWLSKYIKNPKSVNADAKMPPFEGRVSDEDLRALTEYLASLK